MCISIYKYLDYVVNDNGVESYGTFIYTRILYTHWCSAWFPSEADQYQPEAGRTLAPEMEVPWEWILCMMIHTKCDINAMERIV